MKVLVWFVVKYIYFDIFLQLLDAVQIPLQLQSSSSSVVRSFVDYNWKGWCSSARSRCTEENICEGLVTLVQYFILILKHVDKNDDKPLRSVHDIYSSIWGLYWNEDGWRLAGGFASTSTSVLFWQFWREREIWKLAPKQYWNVWWGSDVRSSHQWHFSNKKYGFYF